MTFVENAGQIREDIRYFSNRPGCKIGFSSEEILFVFTRSTQERLEGMTLSLQFCGANAAASVEGRRETGGIANYFIGGDPAKWHTGLPTCQEIVYRELWPGVDLLFYGDSGKLKYDVVVRPGARLDDIRFAYRGADRLSLDEEGNLQIHTAYGLLTEERPVSYQVIDGRKVPVESRFLLDGQEGCVYGFEATDGYDPDYELIVDPTLLYSTYLGGSENDAGLGIAADRFGSAYVTGQTASFDFPITPGAFQTFKDGSLTVFVAKLSPDGTFLEYSTYLGGSSLDQGNGIAVDESGHAYVVGQTLSPDFPVTLGAVQPFIGGIQDAFVTKLSPNGDSLVYSTFLGGEGVDTGFAIAVDGVGSAYVTGGTSSFNFPLINAIQGFIANEHAFVTKLDPAGSALEYSTLLGGHGLDEGRGIAVDFSGNAYVTGTTTSPDFPTTPGAFQISLTGVIAAFVSRLDNSGTGLLYSTYLGGSGDDEARGIAVDELGQAYVAGTTTSTDFPTTPGSFQPFYNGGVSDAFVTKLSPEGDYLVYSTFLGGEGTDSGNGIAVRSGFAYVTGSTGSFGFPLSPDAFQPFLDGVDGFLTQLNVDGASIVFSTFLGGASSDAGNSVAVDETNTVYLTGLTLSPNFPVTPGVVQPFLRGSGDAFVMKFSGFDIEVLVNKFPDRFEVSPGDQVIYFFEINNQSGVALTNVTIDDPTIGFFLFIPEIPPFSGQIFDFIFHVPVDFPLGPFINSVVVSADQLADPIKAEAEIFVTGTPILVASKTVNPPAAAPGDTVIFTIVLENHGTADLINVHITDPLIGLDEFIGDLPVGVIISIDWPFVIPEDALAGTTIANLVQITADNLPRPEEVGAVVEVLPVPRLEIEKTADRTVVLPGETVNFTITVTNTGNTPLTNIRIIDDITGSEFVLAVLVEGQREIFTLSFDVPLETPPQTYLNTVIATSNETEPVSDSEEVTVAADPRLGISKVPETPVAVVGQTIRYIVTLENIGNVPLTGIRILDPLLGIDEPVPDLEVGEVRELVFAFVIPRETPIGSDFVNVLTVISAETGPQDVESLVTVTGVGLTLQKTPDRETAVPGETVVYTLTVTNLLDVPQTNVVLTDALLGLSETIDVLPANGTVTRTLSFTVPAEAEAGSIIRNLFTAASDQTPLLDTIAEVVVLAPPGPSLLIAKVPDHNAAIPGETIVYTLTVTNLLDVPQTNVVLTDTLLGLSETIPSLPANGTITRTLSFIVPADAEAGSVIRNTFTAASDQSPPLETAAEVIVLEIPGESLVIAKVPDRNEAAPGETIVYTLTVTNLLGIPQTNVVLTDTLLGLSETIDVLPANGTITRTLSFTVPADAAIGSIIRNTFTAASDQTPLLETVAEVEVQAPPGPSLVITKVPDHNAVAPGDTIVYTLTVTNLLGVPQTNVVLTDTLLGLNETIAVLPANGTITRTLSFTVPGNAVAGSVIRNTFTAVSDQTPLLETIAEVVVQEIPGESLVIAKVPDRNVAAPGETIVYTLTVTNLLDVPQTNVVLTDTLLGLSETIAVLPANGTITRTLSFTVPADAVAGSIIRNTFTAVSDQTPQLETIAEVVVQLAPVAETTLTVRKLPDRNTAEPGETIHYTVEVTNTGENPATDVVVRDSLTGEQLTIPVIAPGETERVDFTFTVPAGTAQGEVIANRVTVTWPEQPPGSLPVQDEARVVVAVPVELPEVEIEARPESPRPGETVLKRITIRNVAGITLTNVLVFDALAGFSTSIPSLAPGESRVFAPELAIPPGTVGGTRFRNIVSVFSDQTPLQQEEVVIVVQSLPDASLAETVDRPVGRPGETVFFTILARNTGNVPLLNVRLTASLLGIQLQLAQFGVGASETLRVPFVLPDVEEDTVIVSPVTLVSDNGPTREASASVTVIAEEEE